LFFFTLKEDHRTLYPGVFDMTESRRAALIEGTYCRVLGQGERVHSFRRAVWPAMPASDFRHQREDRDTAGHCDPAVVNQGIAAGQKAMRGKAMRKSFA
jgi:hypothetical protein